MRRLCGCAICTAWIVAVVSASSRAAEEFEVGGPLAGERLPLWATQHGEPAGFPGCLPEQMAPDRADKEGNVPYTSQNQAPEWTLYPGSVEHWRTYMQKYMPIRSLFDRQSQIRNFIAAELPGVPRSRIEAYAAPLYWVPRHAAPVNTGKQLKAVGVVRCGVGAPELSLDLGELDIGLYAIRVIGAVETGKLRGFRQPLFLRCRINDGPAGESSTYRLRLGYCDEFYSVAEVYFHATQKRAYKAQMAVDAGSMVDLLVHNISLDDVLAGTLRRAIKSRSTLAGSPPLPEGPKLAREERLARDAAIWDSFGPINLQPGIAAGHGNISGISPGTDSMTAQEIEERFGRWEMPQPPQPGVFLVNRKLNLSYSTDDLRHRRPLPDPYPFKDEGSGLFFPDPQQPKAGRYWSPIGDAVAAGWRKGEAPPAFSLPKSAAHDRRHDAAVMLIRYAYAFPAMDAANAFSALMKEDGPFGRDYRCRRRETTANFMSHYAEYLRPLYAYDQLFEYIRNTPELADSVGRFVPWVKAPEDLIRLLDVYLVQMTAKRIMRYHYHTDPMEIANAAAVLGDTNVTDPWMEWLFARTFIYPLPPVGIQDAMITGTDRNGCEYIGSTFYAQEEGALRTARALERYVRAGGNPKYTLSGRQRYPKPVAQCYWRFENVVAGGDFLRVGDVTGPDKAPGATLRDIVGAAQAGWAWTGDARFAFILKHYGAGRSGLDAGEIEKAAATVKRAPWLDNRSRVLPMWAGILESGREHDDLRFRRAAYIRVGFGTGHEHADSLDLQVVAHGLPATVDGGQRSAPRYSSPADHSTRIHNLVEVNGKGHQVYSWVRTLADAPGARYLLAEAVPPNGTRHYSRQTALIDVDEGQGSRPLPPAQQMPGAKLPSGVTSANSYVFDVFRVSGGQLHSYCFHGAVNDGFEWNVPDAAPLSQEEEVKYLEAFARMPEQKRAGTSPEVLEVTWRQMRDRIGRGFGSETIQLGANFDPAAPRRFTRLHLLDATGTRALRAEMVCFQWGYNLSCLMARKQAAGNDSLESAFTAIVEPFVGQPFVTGRRLLAIEGNEADALRAVAAEVRTANGHTDVCFADGRPEKTRALPETGLSVSGEFAFYSTDAGGLRQARLVGGTRLLGPLVRIEAAARQRTGRVVKVDYARKMLWLDEVWPARTTPASFEIGLPDHMTTYTAATIRPESSGSAIALTHGADYYRSPVESIDEQAGIVRCVLPLTMGERVGINRHWVASDDQQKTFWRADVAGRGVFKLIGPPLSKTALGPENVLRLWEYGVGDALRQSTAVSLRRVGPQTYELLADVDLTVSLQGGPVQISTDLKTWRTLARPQPDGWSTAAIKASDAINAPLYLKVGP